MKPSEDTRREYEQLSAAEVPGFHARTIIDDAIGKLFAVRTQLRTDIPEAVPALLDHLEEITDRLKACGLTAGAPPTSTQCSACRPRALTSQCVERRMAGTCRTVALPNSVSESATGRSPACGRRPDMSLREASKREPRYPPVSISDRLFNILGVDPIELDDLDTLTYSWDGGYETLTAKREGGGTLEYRGVYHPGDGCCVGGGVCTYCGRTLSDAE